MRVQRAFVAPLGIATLMSLAGCLTHRPAPITDTLPPSTAPLPSLPPVPQAVPDAIPRVEPRSRYGNPPFYDVFGKRYYVLSSSVAYVERGVASWYGPGFHKVRTSTGEPYDMYAMSAAHKTLPLPAYVRVVNLQNGRSVVVRVNDRGPFVGNRIIDLSYAAAAKLDMLRNGTAMVEVRAIDPGAPPLSAALTAAPMTPTGVDSAPGAVAQVATPAGDVTTVTTVATGAQVATPAGDVTAVTSGATGAHVATPAGDVTTVTSATGTDTQATAPARAVPSSTATTATLASATGAASTVGTAPVDIAPPLAVQAMPAAASPAAGTTTPATAVVPGTSPKASRAALFIQAGAFSDPANAERLAARLRGGSYGHIIVRADVIAGRKMYRVRIGPVMNVPEFDRIVGSLEHAGVHDAHLALD